MLRGPGSASHDEAIEWARAQYDAFAERRRIEAEAAAESGYVEDLRTSAKALDAKRRKRRPGKKRGK